MPPYALSNPFSTRFVRPGAMPYLFGGSSTTQDVVVEFARLNWLAQVVGPHGSGKSTLLHTLIPELRTSGKDVVHLTLTSAENVLPSKFDFNELASNSLLVIDGYEQLSTSQRRHCRRACTRQQSGLLVTAHGDVGLPTLIATESQLATLQLLVERLLVGHPIHISADEVTHEFRQADGNARDTLFRLYDLYEWKRRTSR